MAYRNIREEELKNKIAHDYFWLYDCTKIVGNIDFCVTMLHSDHQLFDQESLLWAEAKKGIVDINTSLAQLVLTIGKARTFDQYLPPPYLGALDSEKIAFIPYNDIHDIFYQNDFNWNVTPSNYETKEFQLVFERVKKVLDLKALLFHYQKDGKELNKFIKTNFVVGKFGTTNTRIDKNNFMVIYNKWLSVVKPTIAVNWEIAKKSGIIDGDFYLADLLSSNNESLKETLFVLLKTDHYVLDRKVDASGMFSSSQTNFTDKQKAHNQFWNRYERPPKEEYWEYIVERRDLLVPQDVRERKGSYFTPQIWVELSQKYIADVLGENWQDDYFVWDCAAGTGNMLNGLTNKYNIYASTLDRQDVEVMKDRIKNGANLLEDHVFQFDFLNDDFDKLPKPLKAIIDNEEKRKKLVIYINPPYAEVSSKAIKGKVGVNQTKIHSKYGSLLGTAGRELYTQFLIRIYLELKGSTLAEFSKLKILQGSAFENFRKNFRAKLEKIFLAPANSFDNVKGSFPIGFKIWNTVIEEKFEKTEADVFDAEGNFIEKKSIYLTIKQNYINSWISLFKSSESNSIGFMDGINGNDFQHNNIVYILNSKKQLPNPRGIWVNQHNLFAITVYYSVRHCIDATWLNDRDQFLFPNDGWKTDADFKNDCLAYTLFSNNIQSAQGINHWIPFIEQEVNAHEKFESHFMTDFITNKIKNEDIIGLFIAEPRVSYLSGGKEGLVFSLEAKAIFDVGKALWTYYHAQPNCNVNASLHDIREYFQGRNDKGKMNNKSADEHYMALITALRDKLKILAKKIEPKVYEYGFLKM